MIQDFSNVFVGRQMVRVRQVPVRGNVLVKKVIGMVVVGSLMTGVAASLIFCLLIRSGLSELAAQGALKLEVEREQQELSVQRKTLLDQSTLARTAGKLGLYAPEEMQVRRL
ncbi:MAG: hypothetical protein KKD63_09845 [Proteobacteria bacterium]|nr:hypothetical protein [Desulfobulbaceae bacterium]MBU4153172.1 hypothetical protein [Pseudomonadota bacterium]MDP2105302.1 hypothetical protein [Desulfobulbaceae bacterium]